MAKVIIVDEIVGTNAYIDGELQPKIEGATYMVKFDLDRYKQWCEAYPEDIFTPLKGDPVKKTEDYDTPEKNNLITRASASMGRHMIERCVRPIIAEMERMVAELHGTVTTAYHDELMQDWQEIIVGRGDEIARLTAELKLYRTGEAYSLAAGRIEKLEMLERDVGVSGGLKCPNCDDVGFSAEQDGQGEWYQEQCEFCCTVEQSVFNRTIVTKPTMKVLE